MALTLIYQPTQAKIDTIELDAAISESHTGEVEVTEHPVEQGANVSDHARRKPETLSIEGVVSNTPISRKQNKRAIQSQGKQFTTTAEADTVQGQPGMAESAYTKLLFLKDNAKLITVVTKLRTYSNMVLKHLNVPRDARTGEVLRFTAQFLEIKIVQNRTVVLPVELPAAKPKSNRGKQVAKPADNPEPYRSAAKSGSDALGITQAGDGVLP